MTRRRAWQTADLLGALHTRSTFRPVKTPRPARSPSRFPERSTPSGRRGHGRQRYCGAARDVEREDVSLGPRLWNVRCARVRLGQAFRARASAHALAKYRQIPLAIGLIRDPLSITGPNGVTISALERQLPHRTRTGELYTQMIASVPSSVPNTIRFPSGELRGNW